MSKSVLKTAQDASRHTSNQVWYGEQLFEEAKVFADQINLNADGTNVARTAASGGVAISTAGVATFQLTQAAVLAAGDYFNIARGGTNYKFTVVSGATTSWVVTPAPAVAFGVGNVTIVDDGGTSTSTFATAPGLVVGDKFFTTTGGIEYTVTAVLSATTFTTTPDTAAAAQAWGNSYVPVNLLSYWDFPSVGMVGVRPIPEGFRMRFGGTGTATAATFQFVRVDAVTGVETAITTAVATTSAAVWQGVDVTPFGEEPAFNSSQYFPVGGTTRAEQPVDEFVRLVCTAKTTLTTGRTLLVEMAMRRATGPDAFSATP
jgi:hypothetical protein